MSENPALSVIVPVFNRAALLHQCLASVAAQSFNKWECIVVDDGSADSSLGVAQMFAGKDCRFKIFARTNPKKGAGACRNEGLSRASGDLIMFLDSDDLLEPSCAENRLAKFDEHPDCDFVVFRVQGFSQGYDARIAYNIDKPEADLLRFLRLDNPWCVCGPLWKRRALLDIGGFDESLPSWQDWQLHVMALLAGKRYVKVSNPPDTLIRIEGDDRIGHRAWDAEHVRAQAKFVARLLQRYAARLVPDPNLRSACTGLMWHLIVRMQQLGFFPEAVAHWGGLRHLRYIGFRIWCEGTLALLFHGRPGGRLFWRRVGHWPSGISRSVDRSTVMKVLDSTARM
jgi:glycosyltransferase involved in cell wall biosynthesis